MTPEMEQRLEDIYERCAIAPTVLLDRRRMCLLVTLMASLAVHID